MAMRASTITSTSTPSPSEPATTGTMDAEATVKEMMAVSEAWERRIEDGATSVFSAGERAFFHALKHYLGQCAAAATEMERMKLTVATARWYTSRLKQSAALRRSVLGGDSGVWMALEGEQKRPMGDGRRCTATRGGDARLQRAVAGCVHLDHCFATAPSVCDVDRVRGAADPNLADCGHGMRARGLSIEKRRSLQRKRASAPSPSEGPMQRTESECRTSSGPSLHNETGEELAVMWQQEEDRMDSLRKKAAAVALDEYYLRHYTRGMLSSWCVHERRREVEAQMARDKRGQRERRSEGSGRRPEPLLQP